jgi:hypothetical protein
VCSKNQYKFCQAHFKPNEQQQQQQLKRKGENEEEKQVILLLCKEIKNHVDLMAFYSLSQSQAPEITFL